MRVMMTLAMATLLTIVCDGCRQARCEYGRTMLTEEQIIEKANEVIVAEEFSLDMMSRIYLDPGNQEWKETFKELAKSYPDPELVAGCEKALKGRCYQAVWYVPDMKKVIAGRFCVFVDKYTGEVITFCGGI